MSNADGRIVRQATFKAWGEMQSLNAGEVEQNLRFQGQYFDSDSRLRYNTFRYYDPQVAIYDAGSDWLDGGNNLYPRPLKDTRGIGGAHWHDAQIREVQNLGRNEFASSLKRELGITAGGLRKSGVPASTVKNLRSMARKFHASLIKCAGS